MSKKMLISELSENQLNELLTYAPGFSEKNLTNIKARSFDKINNYEGEKTMNIVTDTGKTYRKFKLAPFLAAALILALTTTTVVAYTLGSFDWLVNRFSPAFGDIVERIEAYSIDQGIRMEVIGAHKFHNMAVVYLSLQDISGQKRITESTEFREGFTASMDLSNGFGGLSMLSNNILYFDEETNTIYYEITIAADAGSPLTDPLTLGSYTVYFGMQEFNERIPILLSDIPEADAMIIERNRI